MTQTNPYATDKVDPRWGSSPVDFADAPNPDYAEPDPLNDGNRWWVRVLGWAPRLSVYETPDGTRTGEVATHDFRPDPMRPPEEFYQGRNGRDTLARHTVEDQDADGWEEQKGGSGRPTAVDPRRTPPPEPRPTSRMAPRSYSFTRPFDVSSARQFNGLHFSMADNIREYDILGMAAPRHTTRNTYRLNPTPWDVDIVDMPADTEPTTVPGRVVAANVAPSGNRAWRL